jgi:hypothetical protein
MISVKSLKNGAMITAIISIAKIAVPSNCASWPAFGSYEPVVL